jgi:hypothetical protein
MNYTLQFPEGLEVRLATRMQLSKSGDLGVRPDDIRSEHLDDAATARMFEQASPTTAPSKRHPFSLTMGIRR